jgi:ABC-type amino acid transport system permease subunit
MKLLFNKKTSKLLMVIITIIVIIIILYMILVNKNKVSESEGFTSGFRQMYRPHIRNARLVVEGYYNKTTNYFHVILKKLGIV